MKKNPCQSIGGTPDSTAGNDLSWVNCELHLCEATHPDNNVFVSASMGACDLDKKVTEVIFSIQKDECGDISGVWNTYQAGCQLDLCQHQNGEYTLLQILHLYILRERSFNTGGEGSGQFGSGWIIFGPRKGSDFFQTIKGRLNFF